MTLNEAIKLVRSWSPASLAYYYEWMQQAEGFKLPPHLYPVVLMLCDSRIDNGMLQVGPGAGKSQLLSIVYPTWMTAHDPSMTSLIISGAEELAGGFMTAAGGIIETNANFRAAFPEVLPDKGLGWSNERGLYVTGRPASVPDASILALGLNSKRLTGKHGRQLILDDLHDKDNSATEAQCEAVCRAYTSQIAGRADPQGARTILAGRRWHESDCYGMLQKDGTFVCMTLPAERPKAERLYYDITVPVGIECVFTDGMVETFDGDIIPVVDRAPPVDRVEVIRNGETISESDVRPDEEGIVRIRHIRWYYGVDYMKQGFFWPDPNHTRCKKRGPGHEPKRREYFSNKLRNPAQTEATYQCNPGARKGSVFLDSDFARRFRAPSDLALGVHSPAVKALLKSGAMVIQAWDTAFSASARSDFSVCTTGLLIPCDKYHRGEDEKVVGPCEPHFDVMLLDVLRERLDYADISAKFKEMYQRWQPAAVVVEKKAYAVAVIETLQGALPIDAVMPGPLESKRARAVEGVGAGSVQGWCRIGRVALPQFPDGAMPDWIEGFLREAKDFTGEPGNRDDQVDSFVYLVQWAIRNGGGTGIVGEAAEIHSDTRPQHGAMHLPDMEHRQTCGNCRHFNAVAQALRADANRVPSSLPPNQCLWHNLQTQAISHCPDYASPGQDDEDLASKMYSF